MTSLITQTVLELYRATGQPVSMAQLRRAIPALCDYPHGSALVGGAVKKGGIRSAGLGLYVPAGVA